MPTRTGDTYPATTEWVVEVFNWDDEVPKDDSASPANISGFGPESLSSLGSSGGSTQFGYLDRDLLTTINSSSPLAMLSGALTGITGIAETETFDKIMKQYESDSRVSTGLVQVRFERSKKNIASACSLLVVGPLPAHTRSGNWIMVSQVVSSSTLFSLIPK